MANAKDERAVSVMKSLLNLVRKLDHAPVVGTMKKLQNTTGRAMTKIERAIDTLNEEVLG